MPNRNLVAMGGSAEGMECINPGGARAEREQ